MQEHLSSRTKAEYEWYVRRWCLDGQPEPEAWVSAFAGAHQRRNARAALLWHHRTNLRVPLSLAPQHAAKRVPTAFTEEELGLPEFSARATAHERPPSSAGEGQVTMGLRR